MTALSFASFVKASFVEALALYFDPLSRLWRWLKNRSSLSTEDHYTAEPPISLVAEFDDVFLSALRQELQARLTARQDADLQLIRLKLIKETGPLESVQPRSGELVIGGAGLLRGYLRRPELTAQLQIHLAALPIRWVWVDYRLQDQPSTTFLQVLHGNAPSVDQVQTLSSTAVPLIQIAFLAASGSSQAATLGILRELVKEGEPVIFAGHGSRLYRSGASTRAMPVISYYSFPEWNDEVLLLPKSPDEVIQELLAPGEVDPAEAVPPLSKFLIYTEVASFLDKEGFGDAATAVRKRSAKFLDTYAKFLEIFKPKS